MARKQIHHNTNPLFLTLSILFYMPVSVPRIEYYACNRDVMKETAGNLEEWYTEMSFCHILKLRTSAQQHSGGGQCRNYTARFVFWVMFIADFNFLHCLFRTCDLHFKAKDVWNIQSHHSFLATMQHFSNSWCAFPNF